MGTHLLQTLAHRCWQWLLFRGFTYDCQRPRRCLQQSLFFWLSTFCLRRKAAGFQFTVPLNSCFLRFKKKKSHPCRVVPRACVVTFGMQGTWAQRWLRKQEASSVSVPHSACPSVLLSLCRFLRNVFSTEFILVPFLCHRHTWTVKYI